MWQRRLSMYGLEILGEHKKHIGEDALQITSLSRYSFFLGIHLNDGIRSALRNR